jgi:hypothetical protein
MLALDLEALIALGAFEAAGGVLEDPAEVAAGAADELAVTHGVFFGGKQIRQNRTPEVPQPQANPNVNQKRHCSSTSMRLIVEHGRHAEREAARRVERNEERRDGAAHLPPDPTEPASSALAARPDAPRAAHQ